MAIRLEMVALHRSDIDGYAKPLLDVVIGTHADQWVDELKIVKAKGEGWAVVTVHVLD